MKLFRKKTQEVAKQEPAPYSLDNLLRPDPNHPGRMEWHWPEDMTPLYTAIARDEMKNVTSSVPTLRNGDSSSYKLETIITRNNATETFTSYGRFEPNDSMFFMRKKRT